MNSIMELMLMACLVLVCSASECGKYCEDSDGDFYCCETANHKPLQIGYNFGECPRPKKFCQETVMEFSPRFRPRKYCKYDSDCHNTKEKCCYDKCTQRRVCKLTNNSFKKAKTL